MKLNCMDLCLLPAVALFCLPTAVHAQAQACAYAAINGSCTLNLDRMNPVAPPTIYVRRGSHVTVLVTNPLPFEHLTVDEKSAVIQLPADQFRNEFTDITTALGGLEIIHGAAAPAAAEPLPAQPLVCPEHPSTLPQFKQCQSGIATALEDALKVRTVTDPPDPALNFGTWVYSRLCSVRKLFLPLQSSALTPDNPTKVCSDLRPGITPLNVPKNGPDMEAWKVDFTAGSDVVTNFVTAHLKGWNDKIAGLDADLADAKKARTISAGDYVTLNATQQVLHGAADTAAGYQTKMKGLIDEVAALVPYGEPNPMTINDLHPDDKNNEVQTWDLNAGNRLARIAGRVKADKYGDKITTLMGSLADVPTKQPVVEFKVEFLNEPRVEISSGLLVPFRPYHSFSEATPYSSATSSMGSCSAGTTNAPSAPTNCPIVQQSLTIAVVPEVSFNIRLGHELVLGRQRGAWMWTFAVGYNSATTDATFGTGLSFAYRSIVFSLLPLADRDQHLTGGYQLSQPAGTATAPTTAYSWRVNPSFGISLRVPLGGGTQ